MKTITKTRFISFFLLMVLGTNLTAKEAASGERFGKTLNLGLGIGYYGYVGYPMPVVHVDYEFGVFKNFTLAPSVSFYSYRNDYYYGGPNNGKNYYYHETVIPVGVKGTYYFDELLKASPKWDFYLANSLGFSIINSYWDGGYGGDRNVYHGANPFYFDFHIGTEYHFKNRIGVFLDLSTGVSTVGLSIH
jgi:hypothetical protein